MSKGTDGPLGRERQRTSFSQLCGPVASPSPRTSTDTRRLWKRSRAAHESGVPDRMAAVGKCGGWSREVQRRQAIRKKGCKLCTAFLCRMGSPTPLCSFPGGTKLRSKDGCGRGGKTLGHPDSVLVQGGVVRRVPARRPWTVCPRMGQCGQCAQGLCGCGRCGHGQDGVDSMAWAVWPWTGQCGRCGHG